MVIFIVKVNLIFFIKFLFEEFLFKNVYSKIFDIKWGSEDSLNIGLIYDCVLSYKNYLLCEGIVFEFFINLVL